MSTSQEEQSFNLIFEPCIPVKIEKFASGHYFRPKVMLSPKESSIEGRILYQVNVSLNKANAGEYMSITFKKLSGGADIASCQFVASIVKKLSNEGECVMFRETKELENCKKDESNGIDKFILMDDLFKNSEWFDNGVIYVKVHLMNVVFLHSIGNHCGLYFCDLMSIAKGPSLEYSEDVLGNVQIVVGETKFPALQNILTQSSYVLCRIFCEADNCNEIIMDGYKPEIVEVFLKYIYSARFEIANLNTSQIEQLRELADLYGVDCLAIQCESRLPSKSDQITIENVGKLYLDSLYQDDYRFQHECLDFINKNKESLRETDSLNPILDTKNDYLLNTLSPIFLYK